MRTVFVSLVAILCLSAVTSAQAERRTFIIANDPDGYGIDRCLSTGQSCGAAAANAYCRGHEFAQASNFSKVDRDDVTGAIPTGGSGGCNGKNCDNLVAIVCTR